jgi:hypothetical protein
VIVPFDRTAQACPPAWAKDRPGSANRAATGRRASPPTRLKTVVKASLRARLSTVSRSQRVENSTKVCRVVTIKTSKNILTVERAAVRQLRVTCQSVWEPGTDGLRRETKVVGSSPGVGDPRLRSTHERREARECSRGARTSSHLSGTRAKCGETRFETRDSTLSFLKKGSKHLEKQSF